MSHEDIILLARQAGFSPDAAKSNKLATFAALLIKHERDCCERCGKRLHADSIHTCTPQGEA